MLEVRAALSRARQGHVQSGKKEKVELGGVGAGNSEAVGLVTSGNSLSKVAFKVVFI